MVSLPAGKPHHAAGWENYRQGNDFLQQGANITSREDSAAGGEKEKVTQ